MTLSYQPFEKASEWHRSQRNLVFLLSSANCMVIYSIDNHVVFLTHRLFQVAINAHVFFILLYFSFLSFAHNTIQKEKENKRIINVY